MDRASELHLEVCRRFGDAVRAADGKWDSRSPCDAWDARAVVEHVIGFHDVLILRPLGLKPARPREDLQARWELTYDLLAEALQRAGADTLIDLPAAGKDPGRRVDVHSLLPKLTLDVLVHTWDLARAVGGDDRLDPAWCELSYLALSEDPAATNSSEMFRPPIAVSDEFDIQSRLLARLGRDPAWRPEVL